MNFTKNFIKATGKFSDFGDHVPAPYFRKVFDLGETPREASITVCGLGFYRLYINGKDITKGFLAPYISNPDDILYYDQYDICKILKKGKNVLGICLGNGFLNNPGGHIWDFHKAPFRSSPRVAFSLDIKKADGEEERIESDESCKVIESPTLFDDYRSGDYYDARKEIPGWNSDINFDDSYWKNATYATAPRGECRICEAEPIKITSEVKPVSIKKLDEGYLYDFGINTSGICRLEIEAEAGREISLYHTEMLVDGKPYRDNISFPQKTPLEHEWVQKTVYICKGEGKETYTPQFSYNGFRYVHVKGIEEKHATKDLLTCLVMHSDLETAGDFSCSDQVAVKLQEITRRSDITNFHYFPTDCPHREKNGWTADAALSSEHMLLNFKAGKSFREWLHNIRKAQREDGALPGIVPTPGWGFEWGNGPAWDSIIVYLPFFTYMYEGNKKILKENATAIFRYLNYISTQRNKDGLLALGLGDWCPVGKRADDYDAPLELTDSIVCVDLCNKASFIFKTLGMNLQTDFAKSLKGEIKEAIRANLIDKNTKIAAGNCQTSQAMSIFYDIFEEEEKQEAFEVLVSQIAGADNHFTTGVLGARVIFHVLSDFNRSDLAYEMITRKDYPSYGNWLEKGATTLWEAFHEEDKTYYSLNHHFWGDISAWFIKRIAGIRLNPRGDDINRVLITPSFISKLDHADAYHDAPGGRIQASWKRSGEKISLKIRVPEKMCGEIILPEGYMFTDKNTSRKLESGEYEAVKA